MKVGEKVSVEEVEKMMVCGGCNAKIGPGELSSILETIPRIKHENLLVGFESSDDAAVIKLNEEVALVQTLDFFPSMVSDPYLFGKIAAANALSDVYAMGGDIISALNIVCFPEGEDIRILKEILRGGAEKVTEAGGILAGGHSIYDSLTKYGLSVTGKINPKKILKNDACQIGDCLILTKPLGVGILTTAYSVGEVSEEAFRKATSIMETLNKYAAEIAKKFTINSCTDITGFGLLGHLAEMLNERYSAIVKSENVPYIPEAYECAKEFLITAGGQRNRNHLTNLVEFKFEDFAMEELLFDPQTSGGLLFSIPENEVELFLKELNQLEIKSTCIGHVVERQKATIIIK